MVYFSSMWGSDEEHLDEAFPLGDGTADTGAAVQCPCCGASVEILLDPGGGSYQEYVEDCEVCCRPWVVRLRYHDDGTAEVHLTAADE
jgi:hypothetical protein